MDSLTLAITIACVTSVCAAILGYLFFVERDEADRLAEENTELRAALEAKRKEADTLSDEVSRLARQIKEQSETIASREREIKDFHKRGYIRNAYGTLQRYADWLENGDKKPKRKEKKRVETAIKQHQLKPWMQVLNATDEQKKAIHDACVERGIFVESLATLNVFKNIFFDGSGVCGGAYSDEEDINIPFDEFMARIRGVWVEPVSQKEMEKLIMDHFAKEDAEGIISVGEIEIDTTPKPMTRAEACLAILHEAKDAGFPWAQSAIDQFDTKWANLPSVLYFNGLQRAIMEFADHSKTTEGFDYWDNVLDYREVKSFKPKTKWPE